MRTPPLLAGTLAAVLMICAASPGHPGRQSVAKAAGGEIAYTQTVDQDADIFVMNANGGRRRNLTPGPADDYDPVYSPDGKKIAFTSNRGGGASDVYLMRADGSRPVNLTSDNDGHDSQPSFSPDGRKLAFVSDRAGSGGGIFVMRTDGSHVVNLTPDGAEFEESPAWSPDGKLIAFERTDSEFSNGIRLTFGDDVWVMRANGSKQRNLTPNPEASHTPAFSPNGRRIAYAAQSGSEFDLDILLMTLSGEKLKILTRRSLKNDLSPAYSPDGDWIAYTVGNLSEGEIFAMRTDGSHVRNLTHSPSVIETDPTWHP